MEDEDKGLPVHMLIPMSQKEILLKEAFVH